MANVEIKREVKLSYPENLGWTLCFQKVVYHYDNGVCQEGFRFIWRKPNGNLQAARGQARIESYDQMMTLIAMAKNEGFFDN